jgi:hypothetical protein
LADAYQAFTPYAYVLNNPIRLIDPNGMYSEDPKLDSRTDKDKEQSVRNTVSMLRSLENDYNSTRSINDQIQKNLGRSSNDSNDEKGDDDQQPAYKKWNLIKDDKIDYNALDEAVHTFKMGDDITKKGGVLVTIGYGKLKSTDVTGWSQDKISQEIKNVDKKWEAAQGIVDKFGSSKAKADFNAMRHNGYYQESNGKSKVFYPVISRNSVINATTLENVITNRLNSINVNAKVMSINLSSGSTIGIKPPRA